MKALPVLALLLLAIGGGAYYQLFYPPKVLERETETALAALSTAVLSHDRAKVSAALQDSLMDTAKIHLEVRLYSVTQMDGGKPAIQDFTKADFITFIDNVLYPLTEYSYQPELQSFTLSPDRKSAAVTFTSREFADGTEQYSGTAVGMRYSSETDCTGQVVFEPKKVLLDNVSCNVRMSIVPRPEEAYKLRDQEALRQYLR